MNKKEQAELMEWAGEHRSCAVCWWPESDPRRRMEVHHIVGGNNRWKGHTPRNYLSLCSRCHGVYHAGKLTGNFPDLNLGILLTVKQESDPDNYDPAFLAQLKGKKHLGKDPAPIPDFYLQERQANTYSWTTRKP